MYKSPNFKRDCFVNQIATKTGLSSSILEVSRDYFLNEHPNRKPRIQSGRFFANLDLLNNLPSDTLRITLIGHSSLLIELDGKRILTDPVWAARASPFPFLGPKRFFPPPLTLEELPSIDAVIISHDHYDHLDANTVKILAKKGIPFFCPLGVGNILSHWGISLHQITEFDWYDTKEIWPEFKLTATPARHYSGRLFKRKNATLWASFVIQGPKHNVYYGADSGMHPHFKGIGEKYGPFDIAMLEIGAASEHWKDIHLGPDGAVRAFLDLDATMMMPIHWGAFSLGWHPWTQPVERLMEIAEIRNIKLSVPQPGETYIYDGQNYVNQWWKPFE